MRKYDFKGHNVRGSIVTGTWGTLITRIVYQYRDCSGDARAVCMEQIGATHVNPKYFLLDGEVLLNE